MKIIDFLMFINGKMSNINPKTQGARNAYNQVAYTSKEPEQQMQRMIEAKHVRYGLPSGFLQMSSK